MSEQLQVQKARTVCRNCIFAIYEGETQTGCKNNIIEGLKDDKNVEIIEAYDETKKEFYIIDNFFCMWFRNAEWGLKRKKSKWRAEAEKEMQMQYQAIVITNNSIEDLTKTIVSLNKQILKPKHITVIRNINDSIRNAQIITLLKEKLKDIRWRVQSQLQDESNPVDDAIQAVAYQYYAVYNAGYVVKNNVFSKLNDKINRDSFRFGVILGDENGNGRIVSTNIHKLLAGNYKFSIEEKLRINEWPSLILTEIPE